MNLTNEPFTTPMISNSLLENEQILKSILKDCPDIHFRKIRVKGQPKLLFIFAEALVNADIINRDILKPLLYEGLPQGLEAIDSIAAMFDEDMITVLQTRKLESFSEVVHDILRGSVALLAEGEVSALLLDVAQIESRAIGEPVNEATLRGARESFTEPLRTNMTLLRRILVTPKLKLEVLKIGYLSNTDVGIAYLEGTVSTSVLQEVRDRLNRIRVDGILESGYIEELIEDSSFTPFPQIMNSERPDVVSAGLLEGKVAILTNGTPNVMLVPMTFWDGLQAPDDYYERFLYVCMNRWVRYFFAMFSVFFPSFYIALTTYHPEMVPTKLMLSIASLRESSPFPTAIEVFLMEFMFEGLREAGIRLPKQIGPLVSIVGALVIGEAAVRAGIISAPIVIVVSSAGIASFIIPRYRFAFPLRMLRFPVMILSSFLGLFGIAIGIIAIFIHLIHLSPFGTPYLSPLAPLNQSKLKNLLLRWPRKLSNAGSHKNKADHP